MANEVFASTLLVEVEGSPLPADVAVLLAEGYVEDSVNLLDVFVLRFRDPDKTVLAKGRFTIGAKVRLSVRTSDPGGPETLVTGEVTAVSIDFDQAGTFTEVRGYDEAHRLTRGRRTAAYPGMTVGDVVRKVAQRAGLQPGEIDQVPEIGGREHVQLSQVGQSDWEFLSGLARRVGARVRVAANKLSFRLLRPPAGAPAGEARAERDPLVLEAGSSLLSLRAHVSAMEQPAQVEVRGWDVEQKREIVASAEPRLAEATISGVDPARFGSTFAAPPYVVGDSRHHTQADARALADALAADLGGGAAEVEGVARGNPKLRAGTAVALANVGAPFDGKHTLTATRHVFSPSGYQTMFTICGRQDRTLYGLAAGMPAAAQGPVSAVAQGLVPAIVSDARDPMNLGRVRLVMPWLSADFTSGWARVAQPGAGAGRGAVMPYEVGDEVLAGFVHGDVDHPYVLGGLFNGVDGLPSLSAPLIDSGGQAGVRALVSREGHRVELAEDGGVLIRTGDGRLSVELDQKSGKVMIKGSAGVAVDAGAGALELSGARVSISGKTEVTVKGAQVRIN
jgi:phage protein D